jgi:hypothetical protein
MTRTIIDRKLGLTIALDSNLIGCMGPLERWPAEVTKGTYSSSFESALSTGELDYDGGVFVLELGKDVYKLTDAEKNWLGCQRELVDDFMSQWTQRIEENDTLLH